MDDYTCQKMNQITYSLPGQIKTALPESIRSRNTTPSPPQPAYRAPDLRRNDRQNYSHYEQYDQGAIPKQRYTGFQINQQTPVSNRHQCLSDKNNRSLIDRQPGQKHKNISPLVNKTPTRNRETTAHNKANLIRSR